MVKLVTKASRAKARSKQRPKTKTAKPQTKRAKASKTSAKASKARVPKPKAKPAKKPRAPKKVARPITPEVFASVTTSIVGDGIHLVEQRLPVVDQRQRWIEGVNHIAVIDCSGSMIADLPKIRAQLKEQLPKLLHEDDTISMIWFSGKAQYGSLLIGEKVAQLTDLHLVNQVIDRWLHPVGLTGFVEPLRHVPLRHEPLHHVRGIIDHVRAQNNNPFALFFMTDGCDNQWAKAQILECAEQLKPELSRATFVEYGYYADRALIAQMAQALGGEHIFAETFDQYAAMFQRAITHVPRGTTKRRVAIEGAPIDDLVFTIGADHELAMYAVQDGHVTVPVGVRYVHYVAHAPPPNVAREMLGWELVAYTALVIFAARMRPEVIYPLLKLTGDVRLIQLYASCFGKQAYSRFEAAAREAAFDTSQRYLQGCDPMAVPTEDAFTVLDLLRVLAADDHTRILLDDPAFTYSPISRGRLDADAYLTIEEAAQLESLHAKGERSVERISEIQGEIDKLLAHKQRALTFTPTPAPTGYEVSGLVYNEDRANISLRVRKEGTIDLGTLGTRLLDAPVGVPQHVATHIWHSYAIVKDGLVNIDRLPVRLSIETYNALQRAGVKLTGMPNEAVIDLRDLPIINRVMAKAPSALELAENELRLIEARCAQKVFKWYLDDRFGTERSVRLADVHGEEIATWLAAQGITDGGFRPKHVTAAPVRDVYFARELAIKVEGFSTIPSIDHVKGKAEEGKQLNGPETLMAGFMLEAETYLRTMPETTHEKWLKGKADQWIATARGYLHRAAELKFAILVGQVWFREFKDLDQNSIELTTPLGTIPIVFQLREVEVEV